MPKLFLMLIFGITWVDYPWLDLALTEFPNFAVFEPKNQLITFFPQLDPDSAIYQKKQLKMSFQLIYMSSRRSPAAKRY